MASRTPNVSAESAPRPGAPAWLAVVALLAVLGAVTAGSIVGFRYLRPRFDINYGVYLTLEGRRDEALDHLERVAARYPGVPLARHAREALILTREVPEESAEPPEARPELLESVVRYLGGEGPPAGASPDRFAGEAQPALFITEPEARWLAALFQAYTARDWRGLLAAPRPRETLNGVSLASLPADLMALRASFETGAWTEAARRLDPLLARPPGWHPDLVGPAAVLLPWLDRDDELALLFQRLGKAPLSEEGFSQLEPFLDRAAQLRPEEEPSRRGLLEARVWTAGRRSDRVGELADSLPAAWRVSLLRRLGDEPEGDLPTAGLAHLPLETRFDVLAAAGEPEDGERWKDLLEGLAAKSTHAWLLPATDKASPSAPRIEPAEAARVQDGPPAAYLQTRAGRIAFAWPEDSPLNGLDAVEVLLVASGEPAEREWPVTMLALDGRGVATLYIHSGEPRLYRRRLALTGEGPHEIALIYINNQIGAEAQARGEDRNVLYHGLFLRPAID